MTFDERRSTGSRRFGGEATTNGSGIRCDVDESCAALNAESDTALSTEVCCIVCFEAACVFNCTVNQQHKQGNLT